jgi:hypothetical protein
MQSPYLDQPLYDNHVIGFAQAMMIDRSDRPSEGRVFRERQERTEVL